MERSAQSFTIINRDRASTLATHVRVAGTSKERRRGLLGVTTFEEQTGLWIIPCEAIHTFGMTVPIDSVFLDKRLRVTSVRSGIKPSRIAVCLKAHSVLELPAGVILKSGTVVGDQLETFDCK